MLSMFIYSIKDYEPSAVNAACGDSIPDCGWGWDVVERMFKCNTRAFYSFRALIRAPDRAQNMDGRPWAELGLFDWIRNTV